MSDDESVMRPPGPLFGLDAPFPCFPENDTGFQIRYIPKRIQNLYYMTTKGIRTPMKKGTANLMQGEIARVGALIACEGTDAFPKALMGFINRIVPVDITLVIGFSAGTVPLELFRDFDAHSEREYLKRYARGAYLLDPFYQCTINGTASGLYPIRDIAPDRFFQSEYYASYYNKLPLVDEIGIVQNLSSRWCFVYSMGRTPASGSYSAHEIRQLRRMEPVLSALMVRHWGGTILASDRKEGLRDLNETTSRIYDYAKSLTPRGISPRESQVAALILQGHSNHSIAAALGIALGTVKILRKRLYAKLRISSQNELYHVLFPSVMGAPDTS
ncbi:helix-turn-helix transcriptional regulator [Shinella daejeonensis]|uniref:helix-turn-helix domain-containing protein n=1 Tax=Shinella daejeonensis TaxID=659017 RepID=UPI0020C7CE21|nr:helix-turn-helix transcriptional regulator [Shinella daejeonensis]MCP8894162.1 helix-turn-helix transcriptional regulator [Shinella daejeonensis]